MTIRVLLADDQPLLRFGLRLALQTQPDIEVVGEADDGAEAVTAVRELRPDVVLMDVRMPTMDGIEATRQIVADGNGPRVLVLTTFNLDEYVFASLRAGASGFLLKNVPPEELFAGIRIVAQGDAVVGPNTTRILIGSFAGRGKPGDLSQLTERERDVVLEIAKGSSNAEIAQTLSVVEGTVKVHVGRILAKLGLRDRVQVVIFAYETGLIQPGLADRDAPPRRGRLIA